MTKANEFSEAAGNFPDPYRLLIRQSVTSTNDEVKVFAESGAVDGLVILAERQTAGRGRRGAAWVSPAGDSLAFSILVRMTEPKVLWPRLALAAGLAVAEALESLDVLAGVKWPNDVWVGGKKVAGILVETGADYAIVGIGLNVNTLEFPSEVQAVATSLQLATGMVYERAEVLGKIVRTFARRRGQIGQGFDELISELNLRCVLSGNYVTMTTASGPRSGLVEGIAASGELLLRSAGAVERILQADEVRIMAR